MIATQELIAAALALAALAERNTDDRDEWQHAIDSVREACARAMVQPAAPEPDIGKLLLACKAPDAAFRTKWKDGIDIDVPAHWIEKFCAEYGDAREAAGYARGLEVASRRGA